MIKRSFTKSICSALNFTLSTVELEQRLSLPSPLTTAPGIRILYFKNIEILCFLFFSLHFRFCPWLSNGSLTNQITITNLFQAVRNLPRRSRLRSVLEVPRRKTQQVQLPTRTRLWLGTSNTFLFKTECLMSQLSHCLIVSFLIGCSCVAYDLSGLWLVLIVQF